MLSVFLLFATICSASPVPDPEVVDTKLGRIIGVKALTESGQDYVKFEGIPYAEPPVGPLRFLPTVAKKAWKGDLKADTDRGACPQVSIFPPLNVYSGQEDCLFLNVYTKGTQEKLKPVMMWIHGGAFIINRATEGGDLTRLVEQDVVVVSINYRLGPLGFMTFGNDVVSGNMGLKDQNMAIQWTRENIANFGGDPDKITLFGQSAGGMSVHAQVLSPYNKGLLAGAVSQSGTMLHKFMADKGPREERSAVLAAETLGCPKSLDSSLLECLQKIDVQELTTKLINPFAEPTFQWYPVVDSYSSDPFLPLSPLEAMSTGKFNQIPFMSGTNKDEGALTYLSDLNKLKHGALDDCELVGPARLSLSHGSKHPQTYSPITKQDLATAQKIKGFYTDPVGFFASYGWPSKPIINMYTDAQFISPEQESLSLMSKYSNSIYNYRLTYRATNSPILNIIGAPIGPQIGVFHGDDLLYFFNSPAVNPLVNDDEKKLSKEMVKFWTNFAKSGKPGPNWENYTKEKKNYMDLKPTPELKQDIVSERMAMWQSVVWSGREANIGKEPQGEPSTQCPL